MNRDCQQHVATSAITKLAPATSDCNTSQSCRLWLRGKWLAGSLLVGLSVGSLSTIVAFPKDSPTEQTAAAQAQIAHGKYLVHHVAQCIQCHTPRDAQGELIESRLLTGAVIPVVGPKSDAPWAAESVDLAGLGNYSVSFVRYLLIHGKRPDGTKPKSPMPTFNLSPADADAVIAYLKSK